MSSISETFLIQLNKKSEYHGFWQDFIKYCKDFEVPDKNYFVESLPILFEKIKNDGASYSIYESLRKYASEKPGEAIEILKLIEQKGTPESLEFIACILGGLSQAETKYPIVNKILSLINSSDENEISSGIIISLAPSILFICLL